MLDQGTEELRVSSAAALAVAPALRPRYRSIFCRAYAALAALTAALWAGAAWAGGLAIAKAGPAAPGVGLAPVGLEARGVDVRAALRGDLDVRDAFNRPVRRDLVERQLRAAQTSASRADELSALPLARALWQAIDRLLTGLGLKTRRPPAQRDLGLVQALPPRPKARAITASPGLASVVTAAVFTAPAIRAPAASPENLLVLRC